MRNIVKLLLASSAATLIPSMSTAEENQSIHVTAPKVTVSQWSRTMTRNLDDRLEYPRFLVGRTQGVVRLKFLCSESGAPSDVAVLQSSGSRQLDQAALRAVRRIPTLHPLPDGVAHDQKYVATILFAQDQASHDRQMALLVREAQDHNKRFGNRQVALGIGFLDEPS